MDVYLNFYLSYISLFYFFLIRGHSRSLVVIRGHSFVILVKIVFFSLSSRCVNMAASVQ